MAATCNLLTFDVEGLAEGSQEVVYLPPHYLSGPVERQDIETNTRRILKILARYNCMATFFVLGRIARDMPTLIREIAALGHEVGCHGFHHRRLFGLSPEEVRDSIRAAKTALEDAVGAPVFGFRAPDFSVIRSNLWALDILKELSFVYDSSIFPIGMHDVYGITDFSVAPCVLTNGLVEIPMSTVRVLGKNVPFGGGGYFRIYPFSVTQLLFRRLNRRGMPVVFYLHPYEVGEIVPWIREMSLIRKLRTYVGVAHGARRLERLLSLFPFQRAIDYVREHFPDHSLANGHLLSGTQTTTSEARSWPVTQGSLVQDERQESWEMDR